MSASADDDGIDDDDGDDDESGSRLSRSRFDKNLVTTSSSSSSCGERSSLRAHGRSTSNGDSGGSL